MTVLGYVGEGDDKRCPTEICNAACCRASSAYPGKPGPCEHLDLDVNLCMLHGTPQKPGGCVQYPRHQADIDVVNRQAEKAGLAERCQLIFVG